jgi:hypothetical protein
VEIPGFLNTLLLLVVVLVEKEVRYWIHWHRVKAVVQVGGDQEQIGLAGWDRKYPIYKPISR